MAKKTLELPTPEQQQYLRQAGHDPLEMSELEGLQEQLETDWTPEL